MTTLENNYNEMMNKKHEMKENGASWEELDAIDDKLVELRKEIEANKNESIKTTTDSMFS